MISDGHRRILPRLAIPVEPHAETIPKGADAEVSIPVEPHAETIPKGADAEAIVTQLAVILDDDDDDDDDDEL